VWPSLISVLLSHLFARPEEPIIVKFLSKVGTQLGQHLLDFLPLVLQRMETQERYMCALPRVSCRWPCAVARRAVVLRFNCV
jgi:hypothetical protein